MKDQYTDWTIMDIDEHQIGKGLFVPNWVRAGFNSKSEAIEGVFKFLAERQPMFDRLGLQGVPVKRHKGHKKQGKDSED